MFITTNIQDKNPAFRNDAHAREAIDTLYAVQQLQPFFLHGFVIMPDHCHLLMTVPEPGSISNVMKSFKMWVSKRIEMGPIWQSRFHIKIPRDVYACLHYIHQNPVKAGLCEKAEDYPWSSACGKWDVSSIEL